MSAASRGAPAGTDVFRTAWEGLNPPLSHPRLREAAGLVEDGRLGQATRLLDAFLEKHPRDATALRLVAHIALRQERRADAENFLQPCLLRRPDFTTARFDYARTLLEVNKPEAALIETDTLLRQDPQNPLFQRLRADALETIGDYAASMELWRELTHDYPAQPECWVRYGNALRALGSQPDAIAAFRRALEIDPAFTPAWICLADLKMFRFEWSDIEKMEAGLAGAERSADDRTKLHFSLGKAYADTKDFEKSFSHFSRGNAISRLGVQHDPDVLTTYVSRCRRVFTSELFQIHAGSGCTSPEPIFVVGMPRAGSTLVEQILASHSLIEGTRELEDLAVLSREIQQLATEQGCDYPGVLARLDSGSLRRFGERYLERTLVYRKLQRHFFVDKMGANFVHIGLIQLILPKARIVDVRRHPVACCFSNFVQLFRKGQNNAYRLSDLGRLYRDYVELMVHFDAVLPEKVHRVFYENLVAEPAAEVRRLLDYLGLSFESSCLEFFNTDRVVRTVSSEQVRRPIYRDALEHWRHYEPWLGTLKTTLGSVLDAYPDVPLFD